MSVSALKYRVKMLLTYLLDEMPWLVSIALSLLSQRIRSWKYCEVLPVVWMDEEKKSIDQELSEGTSVVSRAPQNFNEEDVRISDVTLPAVNLRFFQDCVIHVNSSSVITPDRRIIIERSGAGERSRFFSFSGAHVRAHGQKMAVVHMPVVYKTINKGLFLGGFGSWNYYHWMVEILPKLVVESSGKLSDFPLLVSESVRKTLPMLDSLNYVGGGRPIIWIDPRCSYEVGEMAYIDSPNMMPFNMLYNHRFLAKDFLFRKSSLLQMRDKILTNMKEGNDCWGVGCPKKIFLVRKHGRRPYNQDEAFELLKKYGYSAIAMEEFSFARQIEMFNNADVIVGPTGAAWTNIMFASNVANALCWMAQEFGDFSSFSNLAEISGANLRYIRFSVGECATGGLYSKQYKINIDELHRAALLLEE